MARVRWPVAIAQSASQLLTFVVTIPQTSHAPRVDARGNHTTSKNNVDDGKRNTSEPRCSPCPQAGTTASAGRWGLAPHRFRRPLRGDHRRGRSWTRETPRGTILTAAHHRDGRRAPASDDGAAGAAVCLQYYPPSLASGRGRARPAPAASRRVWRGRDAHGPVAILAARAPCALLPTLFSTAAASPPFSSPTRRQRRPCAGGQCRLVPRTRPRGCQHSWRPPRRCRRRRPAAKRRLGTMEEPPCERAHALVSSMAAADVATGEAEGGVPSSAACGRIKGATAMNGRGAMGVDRLRRRRPLMVAAPRGPNSPRRVVRRSEALPERRSARVGGGKGGW